MKASVDLLACTLVDYNNMFPLTEVADSTLKAGVGQTFRYNSGVTFTNTPVTIDSAFFISVPAWIPPHHRHVLTFVGIEMISLSGGIGNIDQVGLLGGSGPAETSLISSVTHWGTFPLGGAGATKRWALMSEEQPPGGSSSSSPYYYLSINGAHFIGLDSSYYDGTTPFSLIVQCDGGWTGGMGSGSFVLHVAGFFLG